MLCILVVVLKQKACVNLRVVYLPLLHSSRMYKTPAAWDNSADASCELAPHVFAIITMHNWRREMIEFPIFLFLFFLHSESLFVCLCACQGGNKISLRLTTQGIQPFNDCTMHSSVLRRWMMHAAWATLKEMTVLRDKASNFSSHMFLDSYQTSKENSKIYLFFRCLIQAYQSASCQWLGCTPQPWV